MKLEEFSDALGRIDERYVAEALGAESRKRRPFRRWVAAAAALAAAAVLAVVLLPRGAGGTPTTVGGVARVYRDGASVSSTEVAPLWPWEAQTPLERYTTATLGGAEFTTRGAAVDAALLGETLGPCQVEGTDEATGEVHRLSSQARAVSGMDPSRLVAVELDGTWCLFQPSAYDPPATLGALLDAYSLPDTLPLPAYTVQEGGADTETRRLTDDTTVWALLAACGDAPFREQTPGGQAGTALSFTATSEALGVYKRFLSISADGLVQTNVFDYGYTYDIGPEAAAEILAWAGAHSTEAAPEPYLQTVAGTVTSVADGALLVDDAVLCADPDDAMTFRIPADDLRIRRWIDSGRVAVGDLVAVDFTGIVDTAAGNTVTGVRDLHPAVLSDGTALVPE